VSASHGAIWQTPATQARPAHDLPHIPQLSGSIARTASQPFAAFASQLPKPAVQAKPHASAAHVAVAFGSAGQAVQAAPHAVGSFDTHLPAQAWVGAVHAKPQRSFAQVAAPLAGTGQTTHSGPQAVGSLLAGHRSPHKWNSGLHANAQTPRLHSDVALVMTGHLMLQPPQWSALVFGSTHAFAQWSGAAGVQSVVHWKLAPTAAHLGAAAPHVALQPPQFSGVERSTSQPSAAASLQFAKPGSQDATMQVPPPQPIVLCIDGHGAQLGSPQP
jgi:hypothetical protein